MDISHLEIPENAVIILRGLDLPDEDMPPFVAELHELFPNSLVLILDGDATIETMPEDVLKSLLEALLDHQEGRG